MKPLLLFVGGLCIGYGIIPPHHFWVDTIMLVMGFVMLMVGALL